MSTSGLVLKNVNYILCNMSYLYLGPFFQLVTQSMKK